MSARDSVANIPTTSVTGATQSGQDGSTASVANTSNCEEPLARCPPPRIRQALTPLSAVLYIALCFGFSLAVNAWILSVLPSHLPVAIQERNLLVT